MANPRGCISPLRRAPMFTSGRVKDPPCETANGSQISRPLFVEQLAPPTLILGGRGVEVHTQWPLFERTLPLRVARVGRSLERKWVWDSDQSLARQNEFPTGIWPDSGRDQRLAGRWRGFQPVSGQNTCGFPASACGGLFCADDEDSATLMPRRHPSYTALM